MWKVDTSDLERKFGKGRSANSKIDFTSFNNKVNAWAKTTEKEFVAVGGYMGIDHRPDSPSQGASLPKIKSSQRYEDGAVNLIRFKFRRSLIWTHKGAGKGRGGTKGSKWTDKYGNQKSTDPKSFGKMGTGGRTAKPFFNSVLNGDRGVNTLADIAAEELGDAIVNNLFIK
jgi:hypothetical protein